MMAVVGHGRLERQGRASADAQDTLTFGMVSDAVGCLQHLTTWFYVSRTTKTKTIIIAGFFSTALCINSREPTQR